MTNESITTQVDRFYRLFHWMLSAQMPRFTGYNEPHPYATGNMFRHLVTNKTENGYQIILSDGVEYSNYAMGYDDSGAKRAPRGQHEAINFKTVDSCLEFCKKAIERG